MSGWRAAGLAALAGLATVLSACDQIAAADEVITPVHVDRHAAAVEVAAPAWFAPETLVVLCPSAPQTLGGVFAPGPATIQLADTCHSYGRFPSAAGLDVRLELGALDAGEIVTFGRARDWWVVLVAVKDDAAGAIVETRIDGGPIDPVVEPAAT